MFDSVLYSRSFEDDNLFRKFRDLVPEDLDDDALRILIVDNNRDDQQIIDAIANLWNGTRLACFYIRIFSDVIYVCSV